MHTILPHSLLFSNFDQSETIHGITILLFHFQLWCVVLLTTYIVSQAMPRHAAARGRGAARERGAARGRHAAAAHDSDDVDLGHVFEA